MQPSEQPLLIINDRISDDVWQLIEADAPESFKPEPGQSYLLPLPQWLASAPDFNGFAGFPGVWINGDAPLEPLADVVELAPVIAIRFSNFMDGSGFSIASALKETYGFQGDIRAFGSFLPDQAAYLQRCGFSSLAFSNAADAELAYSLLQSASSETEQSYQGSVDQPRTPFSRRLGR